MFYKKVDLRNRKAATEFLKEHFRYNTMNSWNNSTSYANNVKIHRVIPRELIDKAYEIMEQGDVYHEINTLLDDFNRNHDYQYQAGFNGRSSGYVVMYRGGYKEESFFGKEREDGSCFSDCFHRWFAAEEKKRHINKYPYTKGTYKKPFSWPGKSIDLYEDFEEWDMQSIRERVQLVQEFDQLCDDIVETFIEYCKRYEVKEEEIQVPKTVKVLVETG